MEAFSTRMSAESKGGEAHLCTSEMFEFCGGG